MRHLVHMASLSAQTNMHARNLAIVWAPNLLRCELVRAAWGPRQRGAAGGAGGGRAGGWSGTGVPEPMQHRNIRRSPSGMRLRPRTLPLSSQAWPGASRANAFSPGRSRAWQLCGREPPGPMTRRPRWAREQR